MNRDASAETVFLFAYGTLQTGGGKEALLGGCRKVRNATVAGTLHDLGAFPSLVLDGGPDQIHGEIWACPAETLRALDAYEGVDEGLFRRVGIELEEGPCWTYVAGPALEGRLTDATVISTGRWRPTPPPAAP